MTTSRVSVCMASYNGEKYIEEQLISILSQLGHDDEIIISDDNSTDKTVFIINNLNDYRIKLSLNKNYPGPVGNFEQALSRATGDIIFLADQDDVWEPYKVSKNRDLLDRYDLVLSNCQVVNEKGMVLHDSFFLLRGSKPGFFYNLYKNSYVGCCMAFRKEVLNYVLPFPRQIHMHDWWIGLLVELKGKVYFSKDIMIKYVRHGNNASPTGESAYGLSKQIKTERFYYSI